jgi:hypothetical protein
MSVNLILKSSTLPITKSFSTPQYIATFKNTGNNTFITPKDVTNIGILVIGGGGGGGYNFGGGGGAGGFIYNVNYAVTSNTTYSFNVGSGGIGSTSSLRNTSGNDSTFDSLTSVGGGGGGEYYGVAAYNGGSGGGMSPGRPGPGLGTAGQGNNGGYEQKAGGTTGGGGGGASLAGSIVGGDGISSNISGKDVYYSGGGGGGTQSSLVNANGGLGGGGQGRNGFSNILLSQDGAINSGGGGGGGINDDPTPRAGNGGSGIIIISYSSNFSAISSNVVLYIPPLPKFLSWEVNLEVLLGSMYNDYKMFKISMKNISGITSSIVNKSSLVKLSGLPFTNVYNLGGKNNSIITIASLLLNSDTILQNYSIPQYFNFTQQKTARILITLTDIENDTDCSSLINQAIFSFNIIGDENFKINI